MTEIDWLTCSAPDRMLHHLGNMVSDRKLWLFILACHQRFPHLVGAGYLTSSDYERLAKALKITPNWHGEHHATVLQECEQLAGVSVGSATATKASVNVATEAAHLCRPMRMAAEAAAHMCRPVRLANTYLELTDYTRCDDMIGAEQADLLREIFGNPFHPIIFDTAWLRRGNAVREPADSIFDEDRFFDMPALADAPVEAGCTDQSIVAHCRSDEEHFRGCWVVDFLRGYFG